MSTILLTGATGFLGSYLLRKFISDGHKVIILKRSFSNVWRVGDLLTQLQFYNTNEIRLESIFEQNNIDVIVHTATNYGRTNERVSSVIRDNVLFPIELAELGLKRGCHYFINTDSFFNKGTLNYEYLIHYALSKRMLLDALRSLPLQLINCKLEHLYGPFDDQKKFVPSVIIQMLQRKREIDLTDGKQKRDFIYVEDVADLYSTIVSQLQSFNGFTEFEVGTGNSCAIYDLVNLIREQIPESQTILNWGKLPRRMGEFSESKANILTLQRLQWRSKTDLSQGIKNTIHYYKTNGI